MATDIVEERVLSPRSVWMTGICLAAADMLDLRTLDFNHEVKSPKGKGYNIILKPEGTTGAWRIYNCLLPGNANRGNELGVMKIVLDNANNGILDREAHLLKIMKERSLKIDEDAPKGHTPYNIHFFFPELLDTFNCIGQDNRTINVLGFCQDIIGGLKGQLALSSIAERSMRVDPRTSVWIIGKTLKLLIFAHEMGICNHNITPSNTLLETSTHNILVFDWAKSELFSEGVVSVPAAREDLVNLGRIAFQILGGDYEKGTIPDDPQLTDGRYLELLNRMASGKMYNARRTYDEFYQLADSLWPRKYWPYTEHPL